MGRNSTNPVLEYFDYSVDDDKSTCKLCKQILSGRHSTNLEKHYKRFHQEIFDKIVLAKKSESGSKSSKRNLESGREESPPPLKKKMQPKISDVFQSKAVTIRMSTDDLRLACLEMVTVNGRPFKMLEDSGFKKIIDPIQESLKSKTRINAQNIRDDILVSASELKLKITNQLSKKMISLKVDAATRMNRSFLGINVQFMEENQIVLRTLSVHELHQSHTGAYLKDVIINCLESFGVKNTQIYTITCDNGANMIKCVDLIRDQLCQKNQLIEEVFGDAEDDIGDELMGSLFEAMKLIEAEMLEDLETVMGNVGIIQTVRCGAHTMQLAVFDCIKKDKTVEKTLSKAREIVKKLRTPTMSMILKVRVIL